MRLAQFVAGLTRGSFDSIQLQPLSTSKSLINILNNTVNGILANKHFLVKSSSQTSRKVYFQHNGTLS